MKGKESRERESREKAKKAEKKKARVVVFHVTPTAGDRVKGLQIGVVGNGGDREVIERSWR